MLLLLIRVPSCQPNAACRNVRGLVAHSRHDVENVMSVMRVCMRVRTVRLFS